MLPKKLTDRIEELAKNYAPHFSNQRMYKTGATTIATELYQEIELLREDIKDALNHDIKYLKFMFDRYREVNKEKVAICKMNPPLDTGIRKIEEALTNFDKYLKEQEGE